MCQSCGNINYLEQKSEFGNRKMGHLRNKENATDYVAISSWDRSLATITTSLHLIQKYDDGFNKHIYLFIQEFLTLFWKQVYLEIKQESKCIELCFFLTFNLGN